MGVRRWAVVPLVLLAACSSEPESTAGPPFPPAATESRPAAASPSAASTDPLPAVPAASAGPLDVGSVPSPAMLGAGWSTFVDPGSAADGYLGNGDFVRERDRDELVASLVPLGCAGVGSVPVLPRPQHALEATYRHENGAAAVVVVLGYPDEAAARSLLRELAAVVAACPPSGAATDPAAAYRLSIEVLRSDEDELRDVRRETGQGASPAQWVEVAVREGPRVALAVTEVPPDVAGPGIEQLSNRLRAAIRDT